MLSRAVQLSMKMVLAGPMSRHGNAARYNLREEAIMDGERRSCNRIDKGDREAVKNGLGKRKGCLFTLDIDGARLLSQVISDGYEARSLILTNNIEFSRWAAIFANEKLAAAAVDRIVHHGRLIEFNESSRRMDASLMLGKGGD